MDWKNFCIDGFIKREGELFRLESEKEKIITCTYEKGILEVYVRYDFNSEKPLLLSSEAKTNDAIKIVILPYRIELYVNSKLEDEEWPCGKADFANGRIVDNNCSVFIKEYTKETLIQENVLGTFTDAEGWKPEKKVFVGDCMPYCFNEKYHVLYLKDRHHHRSKWGKGAHQWSHISTKDFINWDIHPMAVEIDEPREGSICTGSWIYDGNRHYLFYTVRMTDGSAASISRSVSEDGYHFRKDRNFDFSLSNRYDAESARDPKIIKDENGLYHMILTTSDHKHECGCLAHLVSEDLNSWKEMEEPVYLAPKDMGQPECPDYFYKDGFFYLIYSLKGKGYYQYSRQMFTDWIIPKNPVIPCSSVPKAAVWKDRLIFTGFKPENGYAGTMTFLEAAVQENGELSYKQLS